MTTNRVITSHLVPAKTETLQNSSDTSYNLKMHHLESTFIPVLKMLTKVARIGTTTTHKLSENGTFYTLKSFVYIFNFAS